MIVNEISPHRSAPTSKEEKITELKDNQTYNPENYGVIYARQSIIKETHSLQSQVDHCKRRLKKEQLLLYDVYQDQVPGRRIPFYKRDGFKRLLNDMEANMFKTIIITRRDRLTREISDFMKLKKIFQKHGVRVIYTNEGEFDQSNSSYISSFVENIIMAIGTLEPDTIVERTSAGRKKAREDGQYNSGSNVPFGFMRTKPKLYEKNHEEAGVIERIFNDYPSVMSDTQSVKDFINSLNKDIPSKKYFTKTTIRNIIQNPIYAKLMLKNPKTHIVETILWDESRKKYCIDFDENYVEAQNVDRIIPIKTWESTVIKIMKDKINQPTTPKNYLFKNLLFCDTCGKSIKLVGEKYTCKKGCFKNSVKNIFVAISQRIIKDVNNDMLSKILSPQLLSINESISGKRRSLASKELDLRLSINRFIKEPLNDDLEKEILDLKCAMECLKSEISDLGNKKRMIEFKFNNIDFFKSELIDYLEADSATSTYLQEQWEAIDQQFNQFIVKVVLKNIYNNTKCSAKNIYS